MNFNMNCILTIAGSDSCAGAGAQGDLRTIINNGGYGLTCLTAITAQNTHQVSQSIPLPAHIVTAQLDALFNDFTIGTVKIGMLGTDGIVLAVANFLSNLSVPIVIDPVMFSSSGTQLLSNLGIDCLQKELLPLATLITPNIPEAEYLTKQKLTSDVHVEHACQMLARTYNCSVLIKGGHRFDNQSISTDVLFYNDTYYTFTQPRLLDVNVHGTGCAYSSAIATHMAQGETLPHAVELSNNYLYEKIKSAVSLGNGAKLMV